MTSDEMFALAIEELQARFRFESAETLITNPTSLEKQVAISDALSEVNAFPPATSLTLDSAFGNNYDPLVRNLVFLGTGKNIIRLLLVDWTQNGFSLNLDEFNLEDRLPRYESLFNTLNQEFQDRIEKFKTSTQKHTRLAYAQTSNPLTTVRTYTSTSSYRRW